MDASSLHDAFFVFVPFRGFFKARCTKKKTGTKDGRTEDVKIFIGRRDGLDVCGRDIVDIVDKGGWICQEREKEENRGDCCFDVVKENMQTVGATKDDVRDRGGMEAEDLQWQPLKGAAKRGRIICAGNQTYIWRWIISITFFLIYEKAMLLWSRCVYELHSIKS